MKTSVKRRKFGNTGLYVSEVGFGAMNLRNVATIEEAKKTINYVLDRGINLIDTALGYTGVNPTGEAVASEKLVGEVIASRSDIDEPIVIVTKGHGYTPEQFDIDLEKSLSNLGISKRDGALYIGSNEIKLVYFYHGIKYDRWVQMKETGAIERGLMHKAAGDFTYLGFSSHYYDGDVITEAIASGYFQVMELPYNVYNRSVAPYIRAAYDKGIAVVNMKCFNGNAMVLTANIIKDICSISYSDMLRFCLANEYISTIDAGVKFPCEFAADIEASLLPPMEEARVKELTEEADRVSPLFNNICRECMHCLEKFECVQGINFPEILGTHARYGIAKSLGKDVSPYREKYASLGEPKADSCIACGACVEWCEYHLDIPALMKKALEDLA